MKTNLLKNLVCKVRGLAVLLVLMFVHAQAWATTITLKVWDHSSGAYIDHHTIEKGEQPGDVMLYDGVWSYYSVVAWAPGEQVEDIVHPNNSGSTYYGNYGWPNANYNGDNTILYAVYECTSAYAHDNDTYWTTKPNVPILATCEDLTKPSSLTQNTRYDDSGTTKVRCQWSCASDVTTHATNLKFSYGLMGESAINTWSDISKTATQWKYPRSSLSSGWYWWKIQALGDGGFDYCNSEIATSSFCIDDVDVSTPSGLSFSPTSSSAGTLSWDAMSGAAGYIVTIQTSGSPIVGFDGEMVDGTSINVTGLSAGVTYDVVLQAYNNCADESLENTSFSFSIVEYTVHWYVNGVLWEGASHGNPTTAVLSGNKPGTWPTPPVAGTDGCGDTFIGWTKCAISGSVGSESSVRANGCGLYTTQAGLPNITANTTFYAVFADENP